MPTGTRKDGLLRPLFRRLQGWTSAAGRRFALDLLFPPRCARCDVDLIDPPDELLLCEPCCELLATEKWQGCGRCGASTPPELPARASCGWCESMRLSMDRTVVLGPYQEELREAVLAVKRVSGEPLAVALARLLWRYRQESLCQLEVNVVVPVPMYWARRFARGTNNPDILATDLARKLEIPIEAPALRRCRNTLAQAKLPPSKRFRNVRGAFRVKRGYDLRGARVLLVDDILTTGATSSEAARALKKGGAEMVAVAVVARAEGRDVPR